MNLRMCTYAPIHLSAYAYVAGGNIDQNLLTARPPGCWCVCPGRKHGYAFMTGPGGLPAMADGSASYDENNERKSGVITA